MVLGHSNNTCSTSERRECALTLACCSCKRQRFIASLHSSSVASVNDATPSLAFRRRRKIKQGEDLKGRQVQGQHRHRHGHTDTQTHRHTDTHTHTQKKGTALSLQNTRPASEHAKRRQVADVQSVWVQHTHHFTNWV